MPDNTQLIEETVVENKRLGRHLHHDARSLGFRAVPAGEAAPTISHVWKRESVFDQGQLGSCTGNAVVGVASATQFRQKGHRYNEALAVKVYELATTLDTIPGSYPPDDTGSTGLDACKAVVQLGAALAYRWAFGVDELAATCARIGPCAVGTDWHEGMDNPDAHGLVSASGKIRGGHEYEVIGWHGDTSLGAPEARVFECQNSWGKGWGVKGTGGKGGRFFVPYADMANLLAAGGDCVTITNS